MKSNIFLNNPVKVVVFDPIKRLNKHTYVFLGDVPKSIWNACHYYHSVVASQRNAYDKLLKDHYGPSFKAILGLNIKDISKGWITEEPTEYRLVGASEAAEQSNDNIEDIALWQDDAPDSMSQAHNSPGIHLDQSEARYDVNHYSNMRDKYDMGCLHEISDGLSVTNVKVRDIVWMLHADIDAPHTDTCDIEVPIIVSRDDANDRYAVLDGLCRLKKAIEVGVDELPAKVVARDDLIKCTRGSAGPSVIVSGEEVDYSDIEALLNETDTQAPQTADGRPAKVPKLPGLAPDLVVEFSPGIEYVTDVHVFPEDRFSELKDKIYLTSGIPAYRQHVFYIDSNLLRTVYQVHAEGIYNVDIRHLSEFKDHVYDIPIDKLLYELRSSIKIEALDTFKILGETLTFNNVVYVVDIAQFTARLRTQLLEIINDTYQFELFYFGFVIKYWPQLTQECFYDYMISEGELQYKYPDLAKNKTTLSNIYRAEKDIAVANYRTIVKALSTYGSSPIAITQMIASVSNSGIILNIRNLFDGLRASRCVPEMHAYVENMGRKYMLRKRHIRNETDIQFPSGTLMKNGITIAISLRKADQDSFHARRAISTMDNEQSRYLFLNIWPNGKYYIKTVWNEEDDFGFDEIIKIMRRFTDPIINAINQMGKYVFITGRQLEPVTRQNIIYQSLNICVFWKKVMLESTFKTVKLIWDAYMRARITSQRNVQQFDKYEFLFRKGMHEFDTTAIDRIITASNNMQLTNHYSHLSNNTVKQKWDQNYDGRIVRMTHRTTDIRFEVIDIREFEFQIFYHYIIAFIYRAASDERVRESFHAVKSYKNVKKLKKLREQDPELFNLRKYGSDKVYSKICQNHRQPLIYTADEMKDMSAAEVAKLTKYWNFTLNKPAYYGCPSSKFPHLSFMVGAHPKHYCLPCCNKKSSGEEENKKSRINDICLQKHRFDTIATQLDGQSSRHIMAYGKDIDAGRLSKLPHSVIKNLLFNTITAPNVNYYLYGVPQHFPGIEHVGLLYAVAAALDLAASDLVKKILTELRKDTMKGLFDTLLNGAMIEYFRDMDSMISTMDELFIKMKVFSRDVQVFKQWPELFTELFYILFHVSIITFIDDIGTGENVELFVTNSVYDEIIAASTSRGATNATLSGQGEHYDMTSIYDGGADDAQVYIYLMKKRNQYYPIFAIDADKYFRTFEVATRRYTLGDNIVQLTINMIEHRAKRNAQVVGKMIDLSLIETFVAAQGAHVTYTITTKFINRQNLCYAVLLSAASEHVYVPVNYSVYTSNGIPITFTAFDNQQYKLPYDKLMAFVGHLNTYIKANHTIGTNAADSMYTYGLIVFTHYIALRAKDGTSEGPHVIGMKATNGTIFYFTGGLNDRMDKLPIHMISHNYTEVNRAIIERAAPVDDPRSKGIGEALYNNYIYQLFVIEFVNYLNNEVNTELRARVVGLIKNTDFGKDLQVFRRAMYDLLKDYPADYSTMQNQLTAFYYAYLDKNALIADINNRTYDFDRVTMNKLRRLNKAELRAELKATAEIFCVHQDFDSTNVRFPNIYLPCADMRGEAGHCSNGKLIVNRPVDELINILAEDLTDSLKSKYLLGSFMDITIDWLQFSKYPTEIITIYRLAE